MKKKGGPFTIIFILLVYFMDEAFKISVEPLRDGGQEKIHEQLDSAFLDIKESSLVFDKPVWLEGVAYIAGEELVLHWDIRTEALISCSICNEPVRVFLHIPNFYYSEPVKEIKSGIYNYKDLLRETILLEIPSFAECAEGSCPKRKEYQKYLTEPSTSSSEDNGYHPFADVDWKS